MATVKAISVFSTTPRGKTWRWSVRYHRDGAPQWACGGGNLSRDEAYTAAQAKAWAIAYTP